MEEREAHMRRALQLALRGWGTTSPNPMVGALVVADGEVVGEGWFEGPRGRPHAEIHALEAAGERARGATLFCTLEPCDHVGATLPCSEAVIRAGIASVVVATGDPNPVVDGRGFARLSSAGIDVQTGLLGSDARDLNRAFERHVKTGLPFVMLKMASSLDGRVAASDGSSKWITGPQARADVQRLRAWADAVLVGAGTALADDPALTIRDPRFTRARRPVRVVVDAVGRLPATGRLFDGAAPTIVGTTDRAPASWIDAWEGAGAEVWVLDRDGDGGVALGDLMRALGKRDMQAVLVEGGPTLGWSLVRERLVDEVTMYVAPKLLGGAAAPGVLMGAGFAPIGAAVELEFISAERIGPDLKVVARVHGDR